MAELTIRLVVDPATGKKNVVIGYTADSDALPIEHEEQHRALVDKLIEGGALAAGEVGDIIVERDRPEGAAEDAPSEQSTVQRESLSEDS